MFLSACAEFESPVAINDDATVGRFPLVKFHFLGGFAKDHVAIHVDSDRFQLCGIARITWPGIFIVRPADGISLEIREL